MIPIPKPIKPLPLKTSDINLWIDGVVTALDEGRLGVEALTGAFNMILDQDGTLRPRPSLQLFGPQPTGTVLGKPFAFSVNDGLAITYYMIMVQVVAGVANTYIAKPEDSAWTIVDPDITFDTSAQCRYFQIAQKVVILNGVNQLTYLDLTTVPSAPALTRFEQIADPVSGPVLTPNGLSGSTDTIWYGYSYNSSIGQTAVSPATSQAISTDRSQWDPATMNVSVNIGTIPGDVESWNLYVATTSNGAGQPTLLLIAAGLSPTNSTYTDNGTAPIILNTSAPIFNSTGGPLGSRGVNIGGRAFIWLDAANPYFISIGGDPGWELDFSPANGGDSLPVAAGSGQLPSVVWNFRSGPGVPEIKIMTQDPGGAGKRYTLAQNNATYNGVQVVIWGTTEDYGFNGTTAPGSLISTNNSAYYLASDSFYTSGTVPELQNLLNTQSVSQTLSLLNDFNSINQGALDQVDGTTYQHRLYWCLPIDSPTNNQIWVLDLQRNGAWMKPWNINCQGILVIQDNEAQTHQLFLVDNQIYQSTYSIMTNDSGSVFSTGAATGVIGFSADLRTWAMVLKLVIVLLRARGTINFTVQGWTLDNKLETVGTAQYVNNPSPIGYGWNQGGYNLSPLLKWNDFFDLASTTIALSVDVDIDIHQQLRYFLVQMDTDTQGVDFNVSNMIPLFVVVGVKNLL